MVEKPLKIPNIPKTQDRVTIIPNFATPPLQSKGDSSTRMIDRKTIQDAAREIPIHPDPVYRPPPKWSILDIDPELNTEFKDNSSFQEGVISESYQRPDKSYFQEPQQFKSIINTGRLVQKFLPKQADINKILKNNTKKSIKRDAYTCYCEVNSSRIFSQLLFQRFVSVSSSNKLPYKKTAIWKVETLAEIYIYY